MAALSSASMPSHGEMVAALLQAHKGYISKLQDSFAKWDADGDGVVDIDEFYKAMKSLKLQGHENDDTYFPVCKEVFTLYDVDGSEFIAYREYIRHTLRKGFEGSMTKAIDLFREWDVDKSGKIAKDEWRRAIELIGFGNAPQDEVDELFNEIDTDRTGTIEYEELYKLLRVGSKDLLKRSKAERAKVARAKAKAQQKAAGEKAKKAAEEKAIKFSLALATSPHFPNVSSSCPVLPSSSRPPSPTGLDTPRGAPAGLLPIRELQGEELAQVDDEHDRNVASEALMRPICAAHPATATPSPANSPTRQTARSIAASRPHFLSQHRPVTAANLRPQPMALLHNAVRQRPATADTPHALYAYGRRKNHPVSQPEPLGVPPPAHRYAYLTSQSRHHVYAPPPPWYEGPAPARPRSPGMLATLASINSGDHDPAITARRKLLRSQSAPGIAPAGAVNTHLWEDAAVRSGSVLKSQLMTRSSSLLPREAFKTLPPLYGLVYEAQT